MPKINFHDKTVLINSYFDEGNSGSPIIQSSGTLTPSYPGVPEIKIREGLIGIATKQFSPPFNKTEELVESYGDSFNKYDILIQKFTYGLGVCLPTDYLFEIFNSEEMKKEYSK